MFDLYLSLFTSLAVKSKIWGKSWYYIEKGIAVFLILWGLIKLSFILMFINHSINDAEQLLFNMDNMYLRFVLAFQPLILIQLLTLLSGVLLLKSVRIGWMLSIGSCIIHSGIILGSFLNGTGGGIEFGNKISYSITRVKISYDTYIVGLLYIMMFIGVLILLLNKHIKDKIKPTSGNWRFIFFISAVLLINSFYFM